MPTDPDRDRLAAQRAAALDVVWQTPAGWYVVRRPPGLTGADAAEADALVPYVREHLHRLTPLLAVALERRRQFVRFS